MDNSKPKLTRDEETEMRDFVKGIAFEAETVPDTVHFNYAYLVRTAHTHIFYDTRDILQSVKASGEQDELAEHIEAGLKAAFSFLADKNIMVHFDSMERPRKIGWLNYYK